MKKLINTFIRHPILIVCLIVLVVYTPTALLMPADTSQRAVITRIGIDSAPEGVEVSTIIFVPTPNTSYTENYKLFSAKAENVSLALQKISAYSGKKIALNLTEMIVVNEEISNSDLLEVIDPLSRSTDLGNDTSLICTNQSAKDFLNATLNLNSASDLNIENLVNYSKDKVYNTDSNIESFYQGYFSPQKISVLGYIELTNGETGLSTSGGSSASGSSGEGTSGSGQGQSSGGGEQQKNTTLLNEGRVAVYKEGVLDRVLTQEELKGLNWFNPRCNESYLKVENVTDDIFNNATITFKLLRKKLNINVYFVNGVPVFEGTLKLIMDVDQVSQEDLDSDSLQPELSVVSPELRERINITAKQEFKLVQDLMVEEKLDLVNAYTLFSTYCPRQFKSFLNSLDDSSNFLEYVIFKLKVIPHVSI